MRYKFKFWSLTPDKEFFDLCMEAETAKAGWEEIAKSFDIYIAPPDHTARGLEFVINKEDPIAVKCSGCSECGMTREEGSF